ncbi:MAG: glycerol kinase 5 [Promethearchaeota archaeon]
MKEKTILAIDSGGTNIRAILFNGDDGSIIAREQEKTPPITSEPGALEHNPEVLWTAFQSVTKKLFAQPGVNPSDITAMGICNQRASFVLWEEKTGKPLTKLISWADVRAAKICEEMNNAPKWKKLKLLSKIFSKFGSTMLTATSMLEYTTDHATVRLNWILDKEPGLRARCKNGEIKFSTLDSWFIYKLTNGAVHATDYTNAGATGLFNPFDLKWNDVFIKLFDFDASMFPEVRDTNGDFGSTDPGHFHNLSIPIRAAAGDQQAALFGHCCFEPGAVKVSQGSGAFVDMNVGPKPKLSKRGLFPLIGWRVNGSISYMLEGYVATAGTLIDWLGEGIGLSDTPKVLNELAAETTDTEGVVFVPTNSGIRFPYFNPDARGCLFGMSLSTHRKHVARAVLEGIALSIYDVLEGMERDTKVPIKTLKVDGGVSQSDILLQCLANFSGITVQRAPEADMTATGVAYLAGLGAGVWKDKKELLGLEKNYSVFEPEMDGKLREDKLSAWKKAINAVLSVYTTK